MSNNLANLKKNSSSKNCLGHIYSRTKNFRKKICGVNTIKDGLSSTDVEKFLTNFVNTKTALTLLFIKAN